MDKRAGTAFLLGLLSATVVLSGCGVPSDGPAIEIPIEQNDGSGNSSEGQELLGPDVQPETSLTNFLQAAAGIASTRGDRLNNFYETPSNDAVDPVVNVFKQIDLNPLPESEDGERSFRLRGENIGTYDQWGQLSPPDGKREFTMDFTLSRTLPDGKWRLADPPSRLLLDAKAFSQYYEVTPLYFQRKDSSTLVPDIRYTYKYAAPERKRDELVLWLLNGPSDWLESAVSTSFPPGTKLNSPLAVEGGALIVDLGSDAVTGDDKRMAAQLAWTLWEAASGLTLRLERNGQQMSENSISGYLSSNPTAAAGESGGSVHYLVDGAVAPADPAYQGLENAKYVANSVSRERKVVVDHGNHLTVYVTSQKKLGENVVTKTAVGGLPAGTLGRPSWVGEQTMLIPIGGKLYAVNVRKDGTWKVQPDSLLDGVGRVSVALDGGRAALTLNGRAYVAPVIPQGDGTVELGDRRPVERDVHNVIDIGWSEEHRLVLLTSGPKNFLRTVTIDNVAVVELKDEGPSFPPDYLVVYCDSPVDSRQASATTYVVVKGKLYQSESTGLRETLGLDGTPIQASAPFF